MESFIDNIVNNNWLKCYTNTTKQEVKDFCEKNKGKKVVIHWETEMPTFDDDFTEIILDDDGMKKAIEMINAHYIHDVYEIK